METYLADESRIRCCCEVMREHILFESLHWIYYKVASSILTPIYDMNESFLIYCSIEIRDERRHLEIWCEHRHWWLALLIWEVWSALPLCGLCWYAKIYFFAYHLIAYMRSWVEAWLVMLPNIRIEVESFLINFWNIRHFRHSRNLFGGIRTEISNCLIST